MTFLFSIITGIVSDRVGIRPTACVGAILSTVGLISSAFVHKLEMLYLTYGLVLGIGSSMVHSSAYVILGHYFKRHLGLVNGIVAFGSSLFTIILSSILPILLSNLDIKYCFFFLACLHAMLIVATLSWKPLFKTKRRINTLIPSTKRGYTHKCCNLTKRLLNINIWKNRAYVIWIISLVGWFGYYVPFVHLVSIVLFCVNENVNASCQKKPT